MREAMEGVLLLMAKKVVKKGAMKGCGVKNGCKSKKGGLTEAGRKKINKKTGSNLKAPQPGGGARKDSFCARSRGWTGERGKLARKRWNCS